MQYRFPEGEEFKHADMKWVDYDRLSSFPVENPDPDGTGDRLVLTTVAAVVRTMGIGCTAVSGHQSFPLVTLRLE